MIVPDNISLYIHIPFCLRKCNYCSFVSLPQREHNIPTYVKALGKELSLRAKGKRIRTIYFGGGTPSLLSASQVSEVLATIKSYCDVDPAAEITMEANPGTVSEPYLKAIRQLGINRLSLGIQSLDDNELAMMGRLHTGDEAREAVRLARNARFTNLSLDLIYGLPGQTLSGWEKTLCEIVALAPEHLSLYCLTLEPETPMSKIIKMGCLPEIDPDLVADQYELAEDLLEKYGYNHYEISNWAKPGYECRHNLTYWHNLSYLGIGVAAHSYFGGQRLANTTDIEHYLSTFKETQAPPLDFRENISPALELAETTILGLRLCKGISTDAIQNRFNIDLLSRYKEEVNQMVTNGLLECENSQICLTRRGRLLSNEVFWRFLPE